MLQIESLNKSYGSCQVLNNLNLEIARGEIFGLLGPNGAGKTTTINIICNLLKPDSGLVKINDIPCSKMTKSLIGVAPQENLLYKNLSCEENLKFFAQIYGVPAEKIKAQIHATLRAVNLLDKAKKPIDTLSGGMQRRMNIAVAMIHHPKLLILDEPTTGLDIETRYEIWELIQNLSRGGMTILLTTHLLDEAQRLCQRIGILKAGSIIAQGTLSELRQRVQAKEIIILETPEREKAIARGQALGFTPRYYGQDLAFWLPEPLELKEIISHFEGIHLDCISRQCVQLEHIYLEVMMANKSEQKR